MTCKSCDERRRQLLDALWELKMAEALKQAALGAAEMLNGKVR